MRIFQRVAVYFLIGSALACGGGSDSPTAPSRTIPQVAGNYSGSVTFTQPEVGRSVVCPATTSVTQSGASVNVAPITLGGLCAGISLPFGAATIDATGNMIGEAGTGTFSDPSCGTYTYVGSGGFFGRDLRISITATSRTCLNFNLTATLTR